MSRTLGASLERLRLGWVLSGGFSQVYTAEGLKAVSNVSASGSKVSFWATDLIKSVTKAIRSVTDLEASVLDSGASVADLTVSVSGAEDSNSSASRSVTEAVKSVMESVKSVTKASESVLDLEASVTDLTSSAAELIAFAGQLTPIAAHLIHSGAGEPAEVADAEADGAARTAVRVSTGDDAKRDFDGVSKHLRVMRTAGVVRATPGEDRRLLFFAIPVVNQPEPGLLDYGTVRLDLRTPAVVAEAPLAVRA